MFLKSSIVNLSKHNLLFMLYASSYQIQILISYILLQTFLNIIKKQSTLIQLLIYNMEIKYSALQKQHQKLVLSNTADARLVKTACEPFKSKSSILQSTLSADNFDNQRQDAFMQQNIQKEVDIYADKIENKKRHRIFGDSFKKIPVLKVQADRSYQKERQKQEYLKQSVLLSLNLSQFFRSTVQPEQKSEKIKQTIEDQKNSKVWMRKSIEQKGFQNGMEIYDLIKQLQDKILLVGNPDQLLQCFSVKDEGRYVDVESFKNFMDLCQFSEPKKRQSILEECFTNRGVPEIQISELIQLIMNYPKQNKQKDKFRLSELSFAESMILDPSEQNSQAINVSYQYEQQESEIIEPNNSKKIVSGFYKIDKIPEILSPYFNYGSELEEEFAQLATQIISNRKVFIDPLNPPYSKIYHIAHVSNVIPNYSLFVKAQSIQMRSSTRKGLGQFLEPKDIQQGLMGNCYLLSALAAIVYSYPELIYRLFVLQKNPSHIFGIRLFIEGEWKTVALDGRFPLNKNNRFCGAQPHHNDIWVMLLEKAWAKVYGSYDNIYSGFNQEGLVALSGAPVILQSPKKSDFIEEIIKQYEKGSIITCSTSKLLREMTKQQAFKIGLVADHSYTLLKILKNLKISESQAITLVKLRNPWGKLTWKGQWSFDCPLWSPQLRKIAKFEHNFGDGVFYISLNDFVKYFDDVNISKINLGYRNSWVTVERAKKNKYYSHHFIVKEPGEYFLTLYQENKKKYKTTIPDYEKSKSWLILTEFDSKTFKINPIASHVAVIRDNTIACTLQIGEYSLISSIEWNYWEQHRFTISSYGPSKIYFNETEEVSDEFVNELIKIRCSQLFKTKVGNQKKYENFDIKRNIFIKGREGLGFIAISNEDSVILKSEITMTESFGIQVLPPFCNPMKIEVGPKQTIICCLKIDARNYSYKLQERYKIYEKK